MVVENSSLRSDQYGSVSAHSNVVEVRDVPSRAIVEQEEEDRDSICQGNSF